MILISASETLTAGLEIDAGNIAALEVLEADCLKSGSESLAEKNDQVELLNFSHNGRMSLSIYLAFDLVGFKQTSTKQAPCVQQSII